jgi:hypothetical protein
MNVLVCYRRADVDGTVDAFIVKSGDQRNFEDRHQRGHRHCLGRRYQRHD